MSDWLRTDGKDLIMRLHIQPGAKRTETVGPHGDALKIRLSERPTDGKANAALLVFVAAQLGVAKAQLSLISGQSCRLKQLRISDYPAHEAIKRMQA